MPYTDADADDSHTVLATSADTSVMTVSVSDATATMSGVSAGQTTLTIQVRDDSGASNATSEAKQVTIRVNSRPVVGLIADQSVALGDSIEVDVIVTDADIANTDPHTVAARSHDTTVATVSVSGKTLEVLGVSTGKASISVTADDRSGATNALSWPRTFDANVDNRPPTLQPIESRSLTLYDQRTIKVPVQDANGDDFTTFALSLDSTIVSVRVEENQQELQLEGLRIGTATIEVIVTDQYGAESTSRQFQVHVKKHPTVRQQAGCGCDAPRQTDCRPEKMCPYVDSDHVTVVEDLHDGNEATEEQARLNRVLIQTAINCASARMSNLGVSPCHTVRIPDGNYLLSSEPLDMTLVGGGCAAPADVWKGGRGLTPLDHVCIDGQGSTLKANGGMHMVFLKDVKSVLVRDLHLVGVGIHQGIAGHHGVRLAGVDNVMLAGLSISGFNGYGVGLQGSDVKRLTLRDSTIADVGSDGIDIKHADNNESILIEDVTLADHGRLSETLGKSSAGIDIRGAATVRRIVIQNVLRGQRGIRFREDSDINGVGARGSFVSGVAVSDVRAGAWAIDVASDGMRVVNVRISGSRGGNGLLIRTPRPRKLDGHYYGSVEGFAMANMNVGVRINQGTSSPIYFERMACDNIRATVVYKKDACPEEPDNHNRNSDNDTHRRFDCQLVENRSCTVP